MDEAKMTDNINWDNCPKMMEHSTVLTEHKMILAEIPEKLNDIKKIVDKIDAKLEIQNGRVKALELWRSALVGGMSVLLLLITTFGVYFLTQIK